MFEILVNAEGNHGILTYRSSISTWIFNHFLSVLEPNAIQFSSSDTAIPTRQVPHRAVGETVTKATSK